MVIEYIGSIIRNEVANRREQIYEKQVSLFFFLLCLFFSNYDLAASVKCVCFNLGTSYSSNVFTLCSSSTYGFGA